MKSTISRTLTLFVILIIGVAAIYLVASNVGNKVVPTTAEGEKTTTAGETVAGKTIAKPSPTGPQPRIKFEETVYNWGTVYQNTKVPHVFKFKNVGESDLVIEKVRSS